MPAYAIQARSCSVGTSWAPGNEALVERGNTTEAYRATLAIEYRRVLQDGHAASID